MRDPWPYFLFSNIVVMSLACDGAITLDNNALTLGKLATRFKFGRPPAPARPQFSRW